MKDEKNMTVNDLIDEGVSKLVLEPGRSLGTAVERRDTMASLIRRAYALGVEDALRHPVRVDDPDPDKVEKRDLVDELEELYDEDDDRPKYQYLLVDGMDVIARVVDLDEVTIETLLDAGNRVPDFDSVEVWEYTGYRPSSRITFEKP